MSKHAALMFAELAPFIFGISLLVSGCSQPATDRKGAVSAPKAAEKETKSTAASETPAAPSVDKATTDAAKPSAAGQPR